MVVARKKFAYIAMAGLLAGSCGLNGCGWGVNLKALEAINSQGPIPVASQAGSVTISPQYVALAPGQTQQFSSTVAGSGTLEWIVDGVVGGNSTVGTVDSHGLYTAPAVMVGTNESITAALTDSPLQNYGTAVAAVIVPGAVAKTANPQVAAYSIYLPSPGKATVQFGPDTGYGLSTWSQSTPSATGGLVTILVAGMRGQTKYHMQGLVTLANGASYNDSDQTFQTGAPPPGATVQASTVSGQVPQPGVELYNTLVPHETAQAFVTDLQGNVIWTYTYEGSGIDLVQPAKLLPNGHFLVQISFASSIPVANDNFPGTIDVVREVDLAGNTIREISMSTLSSALKAKGYNLNLKGFHHDVLALPNGHWVLLASVTQTFNNLPGYPGSTDVLGDVLVDVDQNFNPVWVWNTFDHLDVNRHPFKFPDWTHANALLYSADDHNLVLSVRHQNWLIKIDYEDGQGSGKVLWHLGEGGDFKLVGGTDPTDWFYAQHGPHYFTPNTTGVFTLGVFDNGDDREFPAGVTCGTAGAPPCQYSTAPVLQLDETAMTATLKAHYIAPPALYSFFGGNVEPLANGDVSVDFCSPTGGSVIQEFSGLGNAMQLVWQAHTPGAAEYRTKRLPSLYPGVQW